MVSAASNELPYKNCKNDCRLFLAAVYLFF